MSALPPEFAWRLPNVDREIDEAFATWIETPWKRDAGGELAGWPAVDLYDIDGAYLLLADLPGVAPEDIELELSDHELVFSGRRWSIGFVRHGRRLITERRCGRFRRRFPLDEPVDTSEVRQGYENGIYWARLPKRRDDPTGDVP